MAKESKRTCSVNLRVRPEERETIQAAARKVGMLPSDYMRESIMRISYGVLHKEHPLAKPAEGVKLAS